MTNQAELTREKIVQFAIEAGLADKESDFYPKAVEQFQRFVSLVSPLAYTKGSEAMREAAVKVCDEQAKEPECPERARYIAEAIRSIKLDAEVGNG